MVVRLATAAFLAVGVTFGLFFLMQALIAMGEGREQQAVMGRVIDFVRLKKDSDLELKKRKLPDKKPPPEQPPPPDIDMSNAPKPQGQDLGAMAIMGVEMEVDAGPGLGGAVSDREAIPIVRVAPQYPQRAMQRGIEGFVLIGFTITETGGVRDPVVLESEPGSIFNRSAMRAVKKFKFQPKVVDGVPVPQPDQRISLRFELAED